MCLEIFKNPYILYKLLNIAYTIDQIVTWRQKCVPMSVGSSNFEELRNVNLHIIDNQCKNTLHKKIYM